MYIGVAFRKSLLIAVHDNEKHTPNLAWLPVAHFPIDHEPAQEPAPGQPLIIDAHTNSVRQDSLARLYTTLRCMVRYLAAAGGDLSRAELTFREIAVYKPLGGLFAGVREDGTCVANVRVPVLDAEKYNRWLSKDIRDGVTHAPPIENEDAYVHALAVQWMQTLVKNEDIVGYLA